MSPMQLQITRVMAIKILNTSKSICAAVNIHVGEAVCFHIVCIRLFWIKTNAVRTKFLFTIFYLGFRQ